jgi:hypothetical protein
MAAKFTLAASGPVLIALVLSGCFGMKAAPSPGGPGEAALVSWGQAANGLQAGLGRSALAGHAVCSKACSEKLAVASSAPSGAKCPVCKGSLNEVGKCGACARRSGVCEVCAAPLNGPIRFPENTPPSFELSLRASARGVRVTGLDPEIGWRLQFAAQDPGGTGYIAVLPRDRTGAAAEARTWPDMELSKDRPQAVPFEVGGQWHFAAVDGKGAKPLLSLPPGRYSVTATYEHPQCPPDRNCSCWHGKIASGPVEIEVVARAAKGP